MVPRCNFYLQFGIEATKLVVTERSWLKDCELALLKYSPGNG